MSTRAEFGDGLSLGAWARRAAATGLMLIAIGALAGALGANLLGVELGGLVMLCVVSVAGIFWGIFRVGGAGFGLGLVGGVAAMLGAMELRHAVVAQRPMQTLPSLADWNPDDGAAVLRVAPVVAGEQFATMNLRVSRGGKGSGPTTIYVDAFPWLEGGRVVGFSCRERRAGETSARAGEFALSIAAREGEVDPLCQKAIATSDARARASGVEVAPNAFQRVVAVYPTEAALRGDHDAAKVAWGSLLALGLYLAGAVIVRATRKTGPATRRR